MIQIISRVKNPELYKRMVDSARETASGPVIFSHVMDDGSPRIAETYNLLGATSVADILLFAHDDITFLSKGWDDKVRIALGIGFNVVGVVGTKQYCGGFLFDSGKEHSVGKVACTIDGRHVVKLMASQSPLEDVQAVDGMFIATTAEHFRETRFDEQFDGLWYYDMDFCLRSDCGVIDILIEHGKPAHLRGVYPADMKPIEHYDAMFYKKHGFKFPAPIGDQRCDSMPYEDYVREAACL